MCYLTGDNYNDFIDLHAMLSYKYKVVVDGKYPSYDREKFTTYHFRDNGKQNALHLVDDLISKGKDVELQEDHLQYGKWMDWAYWEIKCFKKGTIHFKFKDEDLWARFNQKIAKLKGYPLFEKAPESHKRNERTSTSKPKKQATVLKTIKL